MMNDNLISQIGQQESRTAQMAHQLAQQYGISPTAAPQQQQPTRQPGYDQKKSTWMAQAGQLNPRADEGTLSNIYDQKVVPSEMLGRNPADTIQQSQERETREGYQDIKNNLSHPIEGTAKAMLLGIPRGIKDIAQGAKQFYYNTAENHPAFVKNLINVMPGMSGMGMMIPDVPKGTAENYTNQVNQEINQFEDETKDHQIAAGVGRLIGGILATLPMGGLGKIDKGLDGAKALEAMLSSRMKAGAAQGATIQGLDFEPTNEGRLERTVIGGIIGTAIGATYHGVTSMVNWLKGGSRLIDDPAVLQAAADKVKTAKSLGIDNLTAGAATGMPNIQRVEAQALKSSTPGGNLFRQAHKEISEQIYNAGNNIIKAAGGEENVTKNIFGEQIQNALGNLKGGTSEAIGNMYDEAANAPGWATQVNRADILKAHQDVLDNWTDIKFSPLVTRTLADMAKTTDYGAFEQPFAVKDANNLVKALNKSYRVSNSVDQKAAISVLKSKVLDSLDEMATNDKNPSASLFNMARFFRRELGNVYDNSNIVSIISKTKDKYKQYLKPEDVVTKIFGSTTKISDLNDVEKALTYKMPVDEWINKAKQLNPKVNTTNLKLIYDSKIAPQAEMGQKLWDDLRATKLHDIIKKSTLENNGISELNYQKLTQQLSSINSASMEKLLGDKELSNKFNDLVDVLKNFQNKPPTSQNINEANGAIKTALDHVYLTTGHSDGAVFNAISMHVPIWKGINQILKTVSDSRWVESNLRLGAQTEPDVIKKMRIDPDMIYNLIKQMSLVSAFRPQGMPTNNTGAK